MPLRRKWQPTAVLLPGESHWGRSLVGYSPWGRKESDTTEQLHFTSAHIREGNGNSAHIGLNQLCLVTQSCPILWDPMDCSPQLLCPWGFSRQEYQRGWPSPPLGDLPNPGIELRSPPLQVDSLPSELPGNPYTREFCTHKLPILFKDTRCNITVNPNWKSDSQMGYIFFNAGARFPLH